MPSPPSEEFLNSAVCETTAHNSEPFKVVTFVNLDRFQTLLSSHPNSLNPVVGIFEKAFSHLLRHSQANGHLFRIIFSSNKVSRGVEIR